MLRSTGNILMAYNLRVKILVQRVDLVFFSGYSLDRAAILLILSAVVVRHWSLLREGYRELACMLLVAIGGNMEAHDNRIYGRNSLWGRRTSSQP